MTDVADWRLPEKTTTSGGTRKVGGKSVGADKPSLWFEAGIKAFLPSMNVPASALISPGVQTPSSFKQPYSISQEAQDELTAKITDLQDRGLLLQDPNEIFGGGQATDEDSRVATVFDVRDALLLQAAETGFNYQRRAQLYEGLPLQDRTRDAEIGLFTDPALGGGGGGGGQRAVYSAPDRRTVEEYVRDKMIVLTGTIQPELQKIVDNYMNDNRKAFEGASIDPRAGVLESIRTLPEYKRIHTLRADSQSEDTWVGERQKRLSALGLTGKDAEERGIALAAAGINLADIETGKFQVSKGRKDVTLLNRMEEVAGQVGRLL